MSLIGWIIFGALAGWLASIIIGGQERRGCLVNMVVGVIGSALGGFIFQIATGRNWDFSFTFASFGVAVLGAILLLAIVNLATRR